MKQLPQKPRLIISIIVFLCSLLLSYALVDIIYGLAAVFIFIGVVIFVYLNPELMRGE